LLKDEETFRALVQHSHDIITVHDRQGVTLYESPAAARILGYPAGALIGKVPFDSVHPKDAARARQAFSNLVQGGQPVEPMEFRFRRADGAWIHLEALGSNLLDHPGIGGVVLTSRDVTERKETEQRTQYLTQHDALTGLPNRMLMQDRLNQALSQARRSGGVMALMFLDLDRFKLVNDSFGHPQGDALLQEVARRVSGCLRDTDTVARLGGDEFTVLLPDLSVPQAAGQVAERILGLFSQPFAGAEEHEIFVSASIGISVFPRDGADPESLVKHADTAMYSAKDAGRNSYRYFTDNLNAQVREKVMLESGLRRAIERGELRLHYQPKIDLATSRLIGAESLVRWQHPGMGLVSPARFIPVAEDSGLIVPLGEWVLRAACEQIRNWRDRGLDLKVAINVSARQLQQQNLSELVLGAVREAGVEPASVELELTESAIMKDAEASVSALDRIKSRGISIAIDDFGTGYSSLSYLKRLPLDILKIDRSFVRDITTDHNDAAIVRAIIGLARSLGIKVIAEGVEHETQLAFLDAHGCNYGQGYLFGKPLEAEAFEAILAGQPRPDRRRTGRRRSDWL
jgi:diguanylate cyclase (GGDEF)-like protein/PAS domain S-box-containing protein